MRVFLECDWAGYTALALLLTAFVLAAFCFSFRDRLRRYVIVVASVAVLCAGGGLSFTWAIYRVITFNLQSLKLPPGYKM
jgi:hypothetical protein